MPCLTVSWLLQPAWHNLAIYGHESENVGHGEFRCLLPNGSANYLLPSHLFDVMRWSMASKDLGNIH